MIDAEMIAQINALGRESRAHNQALAEQREILLRAAAQTLPEDVAVTVPLMYPAWDWQSCKRDMIVNYNGQLYRVLNTPTDNRPPDAEGMLAVYRPIVPAHAGTMADPIPWVYDGLQGRAVLQLCGSTVAMQVGYGPLHLDTGHGSNDVGAGFHLTHRLHPAIIS